MKQEPGYYKSGNSVFVSTISNDNLVVRQTQINNTTYREN